MFLLFPSVGFIHIRETAFEITDDVAGVFKPDGESDELVDDAQLVSLLTGNIVIAVECRMCDERLGASQAGSKHA